VDRSSRLYRIHQRLRNSRRPVPFHEFQSDLEVSRATVKRDIQAMREYLGAPLAYDPHANGYYYDERDGPFELPGLWLNHSELYALLAAEQLLEAVQPGLLAPRLGPLRGRITKLLGTAGSDAENIRQRVRIDRVGSRAAPGEAFGTVAEATLGRRQLMFDYHGRGRDARSQRQVHPQQLVHYRGNWYLSAWCVDQRALRLFAVDRIEQPRLLDEAAGDEDPQAHDHHLRASFGIFTGSAAAWAVLRFSAYAARWVAAETWHPEQRDCNHDDGSLTRWLPYHREEELLMDLMRWGPEVEVLAPASLRRQITRRLQQALARYTRQADTPRTARASRGDLKNATQPPENPRVSESLPAGSLGETAAAYAEASSARKQKQRQ